MGKDLEHFYIVETICKLLDYSENCGVITTLKDFRKKYLENNKASQSLIEEYERFSDKITQNLVKDFENSEDKDLLYELYNFYIQPATLLIKKERYEEAISRYTEMTEVLREYYHIDEEEKENIYYDYNRGGYGVKTSL